MTHIFLQTTDLIPEEKEKVKQSLEYLKKDQGDRILWHGKMLDATLTFILPEKPFECNDVALSVPEVSIIYVCISETVKLISHFHVAIPLKETFHLVLPEMLSVIHDEYIKAVMDEKEYVKKNSAIH